MLIGSILFFAACIIVWDRITIQRMAERHLRLTEQVSAVMDELLLRFYMPEHYKPKPEGTEE